MKHKSSSHYPQITDRLRTTMVRMRNPRRQLSKMNRLESLFICCLLLAGSVCANAQAVDTLDPALKARVDRIAAQVLEQTGVPSASVAVVQHGKLVYTHAYGFAHLASGSSAAVPATPEMRYSIGSISKQFTAAADPDAAGGRQALARRRSGQVHSRPDAKATELRSARSSPTPPATRTIGPKTT